MMQRVLPRGWDKALALYFDESGKTRVTAAMSLRHFGLDDVFDAVETGSPDGVAPS